MANLGAGLACCVDEHAVQNSSAGSTEITHAMLSLDAQAECFLSVMECRGSDFWRLLSHHRGEEAPAVKLKNASAHQGVGRHCVGAIGLAIDQEDLGAGARQKECCRCTRAASADYYCVVTWPERIERLHDTHSLGGCPIETAVQVRGEVSGIITSAINE